MTYFAYCITYSPGWVRQKLWLKCPCLHGCCRDSIQVSQGYQLSALPTKLPKADGLEVAMEQWRLQCQGKGVFNKLLLYCFVPHERAKLLTYHHLHPSPASCVLSKAAPGNSADSLCISNGIVPVDPTGTRGWPVWRILEWHTILCTFLVLRDNSWQAFTRPHWGNQD